MERTDILALMGELKLHGMRAAPAPLIMPPCSRPSRTSPAGGR